MELKPYVQREMPVEEVVNNTSNVQPGTSMF
jgi:hypothetical protein